MEPAEVAKLIGTGEGQRIEFKETFAEKKEATESLCAFANSQGGIVFFGVRNEGQCCNPQVGRKTLEDFAHELKQNTDPTLHPTIEEVDLDGAKVIAVEIGAAGHGELAMAYGRAFVRVGKTNQVMSSAAMKARLAQPTTTQSVETSVAVKVAPPGEKKKAIDVEVTGGIHLDKVVYLDVRNNGPKGDFRIQIKPSNLNPFLGASDPAYWAKWTSNEAIEIGIISGTEERARVLQVHKPEKMLPFPRFSASTPPTHNVKVTKLSSPESEDLVFLPASFKMDFVVVPLDSALGAPISGEITVDLPAVLEMSGLPMPLIFHPLVRVKPA